MSSSNNNNNASSLSTHIPILDGSNYREWREQIKAFLQSSGLWLIIDGTITQPADPVKSQKWLISNNQALGHITLCISVNIRNHLAATSNLTWLALETAFSLVGISRIYGDFKSLVNFRLSGSQNPHAELQWFFTHVNRLTMHSVTIPNEILGLMLLNSLPTKWDHISAIFLQGKTAVMDVKSADIRQAIVAEFDRTSGGSSMQHVHKISTIKRKGEHPRYLQQKGANPPPASSQGHSRQPKKSKKNNWKGKGKQRANVADDYSSPNTFTLVASVVPA